MIDISIIKESYSRMSDEELILLVENEGTALTTEAISALYQEFLKRKLDISNFPSLRAHKAEEHQTQILHNEEAKLQEFAYSIWKYCFDSKYKGKTDEEIVQQLKHFGIDNEACMYIITSLEGEATKIKDKSDDQMVIGGAILVVGCLLFVLAESTNFHINIYISSFLALLLGTIKLVGGAIVKRKYTEILENISKQEKRL